MRSVRKIEFYARSFKNNIHYTPRDSHVKKKKKYTPRHVTLSLSPLSRISASPSHPRVHIHLSFGSHTYTLAYTAQQDIHIQCSPDAWERKLRLAKQHNVFPSQLLCMWYNTHKSVMYVYICKHHHVCI